MLRRFFLVVCLFFIFVGFAQSQVVLELWKPIYRNTIFSTQNLNEVIVSVKLNLTSTQLKDTKLEVSIVNGSGQVISKKNVIPPTTYQVVSLPIPTNLPYATYKVYGKVISTKNNSVLYSSYITLKKLAPPAAGNEVYVDENLNLVINGQPILPIMWWGEIPYVTDIANTGADGMLIWVSKSHLDILNQNNLLGEVILFTNDELNQYIAGQTTLSDAAKNLIKNKVNNIKNHPAFFFYYLFDEPEIRNVSPTVAKQVYDYVVSLDPYHPIQITNDTTKGVKDYIKCADLFFPDPYIHPYIDVTNGVSLKPMTYIISFMEQVRISGNGKKFIGLTPQVFDYGKVYASKPPYDNRNERAPVFVEERCMNYLGIVYGAKGFNYYTYGKLDPNHWGAVNYPDLRIGMPYLIAEKKSLSDIILFGNKEVGFLSVNDTRIHTLTKSFNGHLYIIAVNVEPVTVDVEFQITGENISTLKVISEGRQVSVIDGIYVDNFKPYEVHIYTTNLEFEDVINLNIVEQEIKDAGGYYEYDYNP